MMDGSKTVTAETVEDYHKPYGEYGDGGYVAGDIIEVYDGKENLRCIIKATKVYNIKFGAIPEEVWLGETFDSAQEFRDCHIKCMPDYDLHDDFELVTLHFELVDVIKATM
ncbi:ASCH domain-containing protein [Shewanella sp. VB17]|nr:ASCH domain-containing protein [Shewanella sp. VB17]